MNAPMNAAPAAARKLRVATTSLAGCFGCHMSFLDIDERIIKLLDLIEFDRSPLTDIKHCGPCDLGLIEGGLCNAENVHVLREFRKNCNRPWRSAPAPSTAACPRNATTLTCATSSEQGHQTEYLMGRGTAFRTIRNRRCR